MLHLCPSSIHLILLCRFPLLQITNKSQASLESEAIKLTKDSLQIHDVKIVCQI